MKNKTTYINGDAGYYMGTSEVIHGGLFYHVKMTEGRFVGQVKVTMTAPNGVNPNTVRNMSEWKSQQADFSRLAKLNNA